MDDAKPRRTRNAWLAAVCFIARGLHKENKKVVGIATEMRIRPECSYDFCLIDLSEWTEQKQSEMEKLQKQTNIFIDPEWKFTHEDEYPH